MGVEACLPCEGRYALFAGFNHWTRPMSSYSTGYRSAESVDAGLRIQRRSGIRWFFDAGVAAGWSRYRQAATTSTTPSAGVLLGFGATINAGRRLYVQPQIRLMGMSHGLAAGNWGAGIGWRFGR
jgi:hypothetical protein